MSLGHRARRTYGHGVDPLLLRLVLAVALIAVAVVAGVLLRRRSGRTRLVAPVGAGSPDHPGRPDRSGGPDGGPAGGPAPARLTLSDLGLAAPEGAGPVVVQVSAAVCSPCRAAARTWRGAVEPTHHLELDVEEHVELARRLSVWRTPTSFVFDVDGVLHARVDGVPTPGQARAALPLPATPTLIRSAP